MEEVEKYLANVSEPSKKTLERIRQIIKETVPAAVECISYGMPAFKYNGKYLIAYAPFKNHMSIFPGGEVIALLHEKLSSYQLAKGTIQFTVDHPLPTTLIKEIVTLRMIDIDKKKAA